jgi:hypothetical protein
MTQNSSLDPVVLDPDKFEVCLENEHVRVLEARIDPGQGHFFNDTATNQIYTLSSYKVRDTFTDGSTKNLERGAGEILWGDEITHATDNVGDTPVHALIIELKGFIY